MSKFQDLYESAVRTGPEGTKSLGKGYYGKDGKPMFRKVNEKFLKLKKAEYPDNDWRQMSDEHLKRHLVDMGMSSHRHKNVLTGKIDLDHLEKRGGELINDASRKLAQDKMKTLGMNGEPLQTQFIHGWGEEAHGLPDRDTETHKKQIASERADRSQRNMIDPMTNHSVDELKAA